MLLVDICFAGGASSEDCFPCTGGSHCANEGLSTATSVCQQGFYCPGPANVSVPDPTEYKCPRGTYRTWHQPT